MSLQLVAAAPIPSAPQSVASGRIPSAPASVRSGVSSLSSSTISVVPEQNCFAELWAKVTAVFQSFLDAIKSGFEKVLTCVGLRTVETPNEEEASLDGLMTVFTQAATPVAKLLVMRNMFSCVGSEEEHVTTLTQAFHALPEEARRLIAFTHWERHHEDADWVDSLTAGQDHFLANITSQQAQDTLSASLETLPAYTMNGVRTFLANNQDMTQVLVGVSSLQQIQIPAQDWVLAVDPTTEEDKNAMIRELVAQAFGGNLNVDGVSFEEGEAVSDVAHQAVIAQNIVTREVVAQRASVRV